MKLDLVKILEAIVNVVFLFFGKKIKGYRTILVNAITIILAVWEHVTGDGLFNFLCTLGETIHWFNIFCTIEATQFYVWLMGIVGVLNMILRKLSDTPAGISAPAAAYTMDRPMPIVVKGALWASLGALVYFILALFGV